jgi:outer membrane protein OmpA-like peptidoglycan-associated protein
MAESSAHPAGESEAHGKGGGHSRHAGPPHGGSHEEAHEGAPEWLISFADMVMLMMGFFVILFALNTNPAGRQPGGSAPEDSGAPESGADSYMLDLSLAIREAFNNPVSIHSKDPADAKLVRRLLERAGRSEARTEGIKGRDEDVQAIRPSEYHARAGSIAFADNSTALSAAGQRTIDDMALKVRGINLIVEVRGHVSAAEAYANPDRAMKLALDRAMAVAEALHQRDISWWQMRIVACADNDRLIELPGNRSDDSPNARVEVIVTDQLVPQQVPTQPDA